MIVKIKKSEVDALIMCCKIQGLSIEIYTLETAPDWSAVEIRGHEAFGSEFVFYLCRMFETQLAKDELLKS